MGARRRSSNNGSIPPELAPQIYFLPMGGICRTPLSSSRSVRRAVYAAAVAPRPCPAKPLPLALSLPLEPRYPELPPPAPPRRFPCSPAQVRSGASPFPPEPKSPCYASRVACPLPAGVLRDFPYYHPFFSLKYSEHFVKSKCPRSVGPVDPLNRLKPSFPQLGPWYLGEF